MIAAAFAPEPVIVRLCDFKSNEYANLVGGEVYEPHEENPMLGYRGASRYISEDFRACFDMECEALKFVRDEMGLTNVEIMVPFVRTVGEAHAVIDLLAENGLRRGENGLRVIMMCELPSNAVLADEFLEYFDGFSIGSNDMTQLTLGLDRDSSLVAATFDERDPAVLKMLSLSIEACRAPASTSASAARARATTPISPNGSSSRGSSRCRSTPTPSWRPGCDWLGWSPRTPDALMSWPRGIMGPCPSRPRCRSSHRSSRPTPEVARCARSMCCCRRR